MKGIMEDMGKSIIKSVRDALYPKSWSWEDSNIQDYSLCHTDLSNTVTIDEIENVTAAQCENYDNTITRVGNHEAEVKRLDQYDVMQLKNNGIIIINE